MTYRELRRRLWSWGDQDDHAGAAVFALLGLRLDTTHPGMTVRQLRWKLFADVADADATINPAVIRSLMATAPMDTQGDEVSTGPEPEGLTSNTSDAGPPSAGRQALATMLDRTEPVRETIEARSATPDGPRQVRSDAARDIPHAPPHATL